MTTERTTEPIACSLQPTEMTDRRGAWERLCARALRARRSAPDGVELTFAAIEGVELELRELARLEAECCSFAVWDVQPRDGEIVLDVTASGEGVAVVRTMVDGVVGSDQPGNRGIGNAGP